MKVEVAVLSGPVPNGLYGLCGRKATENCPFAKVVMHARQLVFVTALVTSVWLQVPPTRAVGQLCQC